MAIRFSFPFGIYLKISSLWVEMALFIWFSINIWEYTCAEKCCFSFWKIRGFRSVVHMDLYWICAAKIHYQSMLVIVISKCVLRVLHKILKAIVSVNYTPSNIHWLSDFLVFWITLRNYWMRLSLTEFCCCGSVLFLMICRFDVAVSI